MKEQDTLIETPDGRIPKGRKPTMSELVELKVMVRDAKSQLSGIWGFLVTLNLEEKFTGAGLELDGSRIFTIQYHSFRDSACPEISSSTPTRAPRPPSSRRKRWGCATWASRSTQ